MIRSACFGVIAILASVFLAGIEQPPALAQTPPTSGGPVHAALIEDLVAANRLPRRAYSTPMDMSASAIRAIQTVT